jgi:putative membrane protein
MKYLSMLLIAAAVVPVLAADYSRFDVDRASEERFAENALRTGLMETSLGDLAAKQSPTPAVRQLAEKLAADRTKVDEDLAGVARKDGLKPPDAMSDYQASTIRMIGRVKPPAFDREYLELAKMEEQHMRDSLVHELRHGKDKALLTFATGALPTIQNDLVAVEAAYAKTSRHD